MRFDADAEAVLERFAETMFRLMMEDHQRQAIEQEMTLPQVQALRLLLSESCSTGDLAARLRISAPAVTQLTNRLARKQLIERQIAEGDRRSVMIALTKRGKQIVDGFRDGRSTIFSSALAVVDEADRTQIVLALSKLLVALEQMEATNVRPTSRRRAPSVIIRRENEAEITASEAQTAPGNPAASKKSDQWKAGNASRKVRIEWD